jgi:hypothetical protein
MMHKKPIWNDNPFDQWREEELLCMEKGSICYGKGGGGQQQPSQPAVSTQVQQSEFPTELKPFIEDIFGKAQAIQQSKQAEGFQAFQGPLQSGFDPAQTRAFAQIEAIPGATRPLFDEATTLAQSASGPAATAEEVQAASNPFVRNVIDIQKREAERVSDVQGQRQDAAAAQAGAFGGSRAAILEAERQRNLNQQLGDIESQGQLAAFQDAQQRLAQQRQFEASGATQLAALGSAIPAQQLKELGALSGVGAARQTQAQRGIDLARQEFEAEEAFPSQTLQEFSSVLRGFPIAPTRSTSTQQFSAAQPLSTQLLGVGTQALGALGSAGALKGAFGQAGGAVGRMPVQKYQGGGALNSLIQNVEGYDTQPVIGMKRGGSFMEQMLSGGILSTDKAQDMMRKNPKITGMLGGAGLPALLGALQPDAPPAQAAPTVTQEDIDKQINAALRQRAAQGQQAAAAGAPRAQGSSQVGNQVRQPFKEGGGLSQMVRLPSNRVQFGKAAYADVTEEQTFLDEVNRFKGLGRLFRPGINSPMMLFPPSAAPVTYANTGTSSVDSPAIRQAEIAAHLERLGPNMMVEEMGPVAQIGEASVRLGGGEAEVAEAELNIAPAPKARTPDNKKTDDPDEIVEEVKLSFSPEEAAYGSLIDGGYFKDKTPMINKQNNTALSNISEGLRAYKGFKDAEMSQRQKINEANLKAAASTRAIEKDRLGRALTQAEIREKLFAPKVKLLESYQSLIDSKRAALDAIQNQPMHPNYKTLRAEVAQAEAGMAKIQAMGIDAPELLKAAREMGFSGTNLPQRKAK